VNQQQKEQWLAALRSGRYEQGTDMLMFRGSYCCLGVANEVCGLGLPKIASYLRDLSLGIKDCWVFLPRETQEVLGEMNDAEGKSFAEIADYIEQNVAPTE
jgi:hypothetical protein